VSHSHIPVKHLLKQVEVYRAKRNNRDARPEWAAALIDRAAELFEPLEGVGRVGFDCQLADDRWRVGMFLGATEIVGGPSDGKSRHTNFRFDLQQLAEMFSRIESMTWQALPENGEVGQGWPFSSVTIDGIYEGNPVRLQLFSIPPAEAGPGLRAYPDGQCKPV
jgi:hypothetical protein